jgi:HD superfamily phosphohydrolase
VPSFPPGGRIADPVHGYVQFTGIERLIIGHRVSQRLRNIAQNGLAHLVYPEARTARFVHSLGAMHLVSKALSSVLRNARDPARTSMLDGLHALVTEIADVGDAEAAATDLRDDSLMAQHYVNGQLHRSAVNLAEQALRLSAFFHDLGHLPFSHDFEFGLQSFWNNLAEGDPRKSGLISLIAQELGRGQIHERVGHAVSWLIFKDLFGSNLSDSTRIVFSFAQRILDARENPVTDSKEACLQWLHSIVDGEIDVDRCDYILRDGRNHGFEFVNYDLSRLLDNLTVASEGERLVTALKPQGLSAVESFLLSRYQHYKYGIRHHKVVQIGAALRFSIHQTLANGTPEINAFIEDLGKIPSSSASADARKKFLNRFSGYDDVWWTMIMRRQCDSAPNPWIDLVCWRKDNPRSLWKRVEQFPGAIEEFNAQLPKAADYDRRTIWEENVKTLQERGVLVARHAFKPWSERTVGSLTGESTLCILEDDSRLTPITRLSPIVRNLANSWASDLQVHAFEQARGSIAPEEVLNILMGGL